MLWKTESFAAVIFFFVLIYVFPMSDRAAKLFQIPSYFLTFTAIYSLQLPSFGDN